MVGLQAWDLFIRSLSGFWDSFSSEFSDLQADILQPSERYDAFIRMPLKLCPTFGSIFKLQLICRRLIIRVFVEENMPVLS